MFNSFRNVKKLLSIAILRAPPSNYIFKNFWPKYCGSSRKGLLYTVMIKTIKVCTPVFDKTLSESTYKKMLSHCNNSSKQF